MSDGGKGSKPRPLSVDRETYQANWEAIFKKDILKNEYYDILSTEDCFDVEDLNECKKPEW